MASLFTLSASTWTPIATRGNPIMRLRDVDRVRLHIGASQPAIDTADFFTLESGRQPVSLGLLAGGRRIWARAESGAALLEVGDAGGGAENCHRLVSALASTNAAVIKNAPGRVFKMIGRNNAAALRYLKLYNKATAPTVGTDAPIMTIPLAASAPFDIDLGEFGFLFTTGIGYALTTGAADSDTAALTAGDILGLNILWA